MKTPSTSWRVRVRVRVILRLTVSQSVCLGVEPTSWTFDQILLPFQEFGLEFVVLSLWGALSDERPGLPFVSRSLVICLCVHLLFTFLCFIPLPYILYTLYTTYNTYKTSFSPCSVQQTSWSRVGVEVTLRLTVSQSVSLSWYRAPLWDLRPDITSCRIVAV
jgi:hypothetical protein